MGNGKECDSCRKVRCVCGEESARHPPREQPAMPEGGAFPQLLGVWLEDDLECGPREADEKRYCGEVLYVPESVLLAAQARARALAECEDIRQTSWRITEWLVELQKVIAAVDAVPRTSNGRRTQLDTKNPEGELRKILAALKHYKLWKSNWDRPSQEPEGSAEA